MKRTCELETEQARMRRSEFKRAGSAYIDIVNALAGGIDETDLRGWHRRPVMPENGADDDDLSVGCL